MSTHPLLVELLVEELPPKALKRLGEAFGAGLLTALHTQGLAGTHSVLTTFASPRRLAAHISHVLAVAPDRAVSQKLMPVSVGLLPDGQPSPALLKKLAALGADPAVVPTLTRLGDGKAEALHLDSVVPGATLAAGLQAALDEALAGLPIPKLMQYQLHESIEGSGPDFQPGWTSVQFVRPAHGLVALHGADLVPVQALGLQAGRQTRGHRFEAPMDPVQLQGADHYERQLREQGAVIAGFAERRAEIQRQLANAASEQGLVPIDDPALLDEVTALVEWPNVLCGQFEVEFLAVPSECLVLTMKANQKYFPLLDAGGRLTNRFLLVSNIRPEDPSAVIGGNERVVRPRLADAKFFFDQDRKRSLASRVPALDKVVYHGKLGTQGERVARVRALARWVAAQIGADVDLADRAALLAKADLLTDMVGEFPELQGIMGGYYARHDGEDPAVAAAIADQYAVRRDDAATADNLVGEALLIADRVETIVGIWAIGLKPTGDKDPYAIRRAALGVIRSFELLALATKLGPQPSFKLDLRALLEQAAGTFAPGLVGADVIDAVEAYVRERQAIQLTGPYSPQTVDAVMALRPPLHEAVGRLQAVTAFSSLPEAAPLAAANKRVGNILRKSDEVPATAPDAALFAEPAERTLADALTAARTTSDAAFGNGDLTGSLKALAVLRVPVDGFFDAVMVNAEDPALRRNRLALLAALHAAMNRVADLSRLAA